MYINIENLHKYRRFIQILNFMQYLRFYTFTPGKNFTWRALNRFMPKSGIFEQYERKTQQNYGTTDS